jgi:hypothetical protein
MQKSWGFYLLLVVTALVLGGALWYIATSPSPPPPAPKPQPPPAARELDPEDYPKLNERLVGLASATDPAAFAKENGFERDFQDGKVVVVIEALDKEYFEGLRWAVEVLEGTVETDYEPEAQLQVLIPIEALLKLATHPHIQYIRLPNRPWPDGM